RFPHTIHGLGGGLEGGDFEVAPFLEEASVSYEDGFLVRLLVEVDLAVGLLERRGQAAAGVEVHGDAWGASAQDELVVELALAAPEAAELRGVDQRGEDGFGCHSIISLSVMSFSSPSTMSLRSSTRSSRARPEADCCCFSSSSSYSSCSLSRSSAAL